MRKEYPATVVIIIFSIGELASVIKYLKALHSKKNFK